MKVFAAFKRFVKKFGAFIAIILATVICVGAIVTGVLYVRSMASSLWEQLVNEVTEVTAQGGYSFETFLKKEIDSIETLSSSLQKFDFSNDDEKEKALDLFDMYSIEKGYFTLVVYDKDKESGDCSLYLAAADDMGRTATIGKTAEFIDYEEQGISDVYYNQYTGERTIAYYQRFTFKNGVKALVRKGQVLSEINESFSLSFYNDTGFSYITKKNGDIMIRPDHPQSNRTKGNIFSFLATEETDSDEIERIRQAMSEDKAGAILSTESGDDRVISFIPLKNTGTKTADGAVKDGWYIVSVVPNDAISGKTEEILQSSLALTIIILLVVIIFVLFALVSYLFRRKLVAQGAEVKHREQLFGILANNTDDVFVMTSASGDEIEYVSPNIERVMGIKEAEVRQDLHAMGRPENVVEDEIYGIERIRELKTGETLNYNSERVNKSTGEKRFYHETVYRASVDGIDKNIIVFSDRTYEKNVEEALTEAAEAAKAANNAKTTFLSSMSHDIRTPMNAIVGMTAIATRHIDDKERLKDCLDKITLSSNHLLTLINDVLDISKIESGKFVLTENVFSLRELVTNLANLVRPMVSDKKLTFEIHIIDVDYEYLIGDGVRVNQILVNILSNAVKYTPEGGSVTVDVKETPVGNDRVRLTYTVKDTGIGMSKEYMENMYDVFSRATDSRIDKIQGTGLGLAIVKQMVTLMNGTIECESEVGKGTKFTIDIGFPVANKEKEKYTLPDMKALVVDDDELFLENVVDEFDEIGIYVDTVTNGNSALDKIKEKGGDFYSVVIVDWRMPEMSGLETVRKIREIVGKDTPIILVSSYDWTDIEDEAMESGADGFISKPLFRSYVYEKMCEVMNIANDKKEKETNSFEDLAGLNVLVAEDNEMNWEVITTLLDMYGITSERAENGKICVDMLEASDEGKYDLVLMDVQMPVMNGKEATRLIRESEKPHVRNIPVLAMTADAFAEDIVACINCGMNGHVAKPVDMNKLCQEMRKFIKR